MANFELDKYNAVLHRIDFLRARGFSEDSPEIRSAKILLRDLIEHKKQNQNTLQKVVPRLTGIKTVTIKTNQLGEKDEILLKSVGFQNKYVILGMILGTAALLYYLLKSSDK